jgi:hypothetical protein
MSAIGLLPLVAHPARLAMRNRAMRLGFMTGKPQLSQKARRTKIPDDTRARTLKAGCHVSPAIGLSILRNAATNDVREVSGTIEGSVNVKSLQHHGRSVTNDGGVTPFYLEPQFVCTACRDVALMSGRCLASQGWAQVRKPVEATKSPANRPGS